MIEIGRCIMTDRMVDLDFILMMMLIINGIREHIVTRFSIA